MPLPWEAKWPGQDQESLGKAFKWAPFGSSITGARPLGNAGPTVSEMWQGGNDMLNGFFENIGKAAQAAGNTQHTYVDDYGRSYDTAPAAPKSSGPARPSSASANLLRNLGARTNPTTLRDNSPVGNEEVDPNEERMQAVIRAIEERLSHGYVDDGAYNGMIDEAFGGALSAIGNARTKAQGNYQESDKVLASLTEGHVNAIKGEDMDAIKRIGSENQAGIKGIYDGAIAGESADRQKAIDQRAEALSRYGLEESGMGTTGNVQSEAISDLNQSSADGQEMARGMQAADESLNVARAEAQAGEGVSRRSDLRRDLDNILGDLDQSEASVQQQKSMARLQARQADQQAFNQSQAADTDTLESYLNQKREDKKYKDDLQLQREKIRGQGKGSATATDIARERFRARNVDPAPFEQAYSQVMAENKFSSVSGKDKNAHFVSEMSKKLKGRNVRVEDINEWVTFINGYGTDKGNGALPMTLN